MGDGERRFRAKISGNFDRLDDVHGCGQFDWLRVQVNCDLDYFLYRGKYFDDSAASIRRSANIKYASCRFHEWWRRSTPEDLNSDLLNMFSAASSFHS